MPVDRPLFFLHSLSSPEPLTLSALRELIVDVYLIRSDPRIQELESERRQGRPKSAELIELEETRRRERAEWETGLGGSRLSLQLSLLKSLFEMDMVDLSDGRGARSDTWADRQNPVVHAGYESSGFTS